jgi:polar amino acid transport system substrate-binding protein
MTAPPIDDRLDGIARAGALRLALFPSFFYRRKAGGEPRGVGIAIAEALADGVGVRLRCTEYGSPPEVVAALAQDRADMALLGIDPARAAEVDFSPPVLAADFTYLVPPDCAVRTIADADRPGVRIALVRHHAMDTALRGKLARAERVYAGTPDEAFALLRAGGADVLAGIRPGLLRYARELTGARVLSDCYGRNVIALAVKKGDAARLAMVADFVRRARADGTIERAIADTGTDGVQMD